MLEEHIQKRLQEKPILLMTHIVAGYPSFDEGRRIVAQMVEAGVDLMELQIPFSEPIADGPVILRANQSALASGATVERCLEFAQEMARTHPIPFLVMSYYNILFKHGVRRFAERLQSMGVRGAIVPDLPPEEASEYLDAMRATSLDPIFIFSPRSTGERLEKIAACASGFVYCVARKGVTGAQTQFQDDIEQYLARCRKATALPLAVGFGVRQKTDVDFLRGKAEIAVVGTETLRVIDRDGIEAVKPFLAGLR